MSSLLYPLLFCRVIVWSRGDGSWVKPELNKQLTKAPRVDLEIRRENVGQRPCRGQGTAALKERSQHCKCGHSPPFTIREWKLFSHHNSRLSRQRIPLSLIGDLGITWNHVHKIVLKLYSSVQMLWWIPLSPLPSSLLFQIGLVGAWAAHNDLPFQVWFTGQHKDSFHHYFLGNSLQINTVTWYSTFLVKYFFFLFWKIRCTIKRILVIHLFAFYLYSYIMESHHMLGSMLRQRNCHQQ